MQSAQRCKRIPIFTHFFSVCAAVGAQFDGFARQLARKLMVSRVCVHTGARGGDAIYLLTTWASKVYLIVTFRTRFDPKATAAATVRVLPMVDSRGTAYGPLQRCKIPS